MSGGENVDVVARLKRLKAQKNWTNYRIAKVCGLNQSTVENIFHRNMTPHIDTLEILCKGFGISLSQFFNEDINENEQLIVLNDEETHFLSLFNTLNADQKETIFKLMKLFK